MTSNETTQLPPIGNMLRLTFEKWYNDDIPRHAAVLAFYALFAVAPILLLCVEVLGLIYGRDAAEQHVLAQVNSFVDNAETGAWVNTFLHNILPSSANWWVTAGFILALLYGASSFFNELKIVLNLVWGVPVPDEPNIGRFIWRRLQAVLMVMISSLLIFFGLILTSWLSMLTEWAALYLKIGSGDPTWSYLVLVFIFLTIVFALVYKFVPDADVAWQNVWIGAAATALLISITRLLISLYFNHSYTTTMFGAASALVVILLSVYYSAQIFFLGAEFTYVYSQVGAENMEQENGAAADQPASSRTLPPRQTGPVKLDVVNIATEEPEPTTAPLDQPEPAKISRFAALTQPIRNRLPRLNFGKKDAPNPPESTDRLLSSEAVKEPITDRPLSSETVEGPNIGPRNRVRSIGSKVKKIILLPVRILRPVRQVVVAVGVIFAVSLAALAGFPFWKKRKYNGRIDPPTEDE